MAATRAARGVNCPFSRISYGSTMAGETFWACCGIAVLGLVLIGSQPGNRVPPAPHPTPVVSKPIAAPLGNGYASVTLPRSQDGHFYADAQVNGASVRFLLDTGATGLVLTKSDAQRAGLGSGNYDARGIGAGGEVRLMPATLGRIAIGPLGADNVPAMVAESGLPVSLMGQSFLSRIGSLTISNDQLVLR